MAIEADVWPVFIHTARDRGAFPEGSSERGGVDK